MKTFKFGVEIEVTRKTRLTVATAVQTVVGGSVHHIGYPASYDPYEVIAADGRVWKVVGDSSLSGPRDQQAEVVSPILGWDDIEVIQEIVRALRKAGCRFDQTTSVHIHCSHPDLNPKTIRSLVKIVHKHESIIQQIFQVSNARKSRYCRTMDDSVAKRFDEKITTERELNEAWYGSYNPVPHRHDHNRYSGLNLTSFIVRKTIEFRWAAPKTLHAGEVKAVIVFVLALCARALKVKNCSSKKKEFNPKTARYDGRILILALGLIGEEHRSTRMHLLSHLEGSAAWKHGRPERLREAA